MHGDQKLVYQMTQDVELFDSTGVQMMDKYSTLCVHMQIHINSMIHVRQALP